MAELGGCCPVCLEAFSSKKVGKIIPGCFHTVCAGCINTLPEPRCPLDRTEFQVPEGGATHLTTNFALMDVLANDLVDSGEEQEAVLCIFCDDAEASLRCVECEGDPFCSECWTQHRKARSCQDHGSVPVADLAIQGANKLVCSDHPSQELLYFCVEDRELFCAYCFPTSLHRQHEVVAVSKALEHMDLDKSIRELSEFEVTIQQTITQAEEEDKKVAEAAISAKNEIEGVFDSITAAFQARKEELLKQVASAAGSRSKQLVQQKEELWFAKNSISSGLEQIAYFSAKKDHARSVYFAAQLLTNMATAKSRELTPNLVANADFQVAFIHDSTQAKAQVFGAIITKDDLPIEGKQSSILTPETLRILARMLSQDDSSSRKLTLIHDLPMGNSAHHFDEAVRGKGSVLVVIRDRTSKAVFGAYVADVLSSSSGWRPGDKANFIFWLGKTDSQSGPFIKRQGPNHQLHFGSCGLHMGQSGGFVAFCNSWSVNRSSLFSEFPNAASFSLADQSQAQSTGSAVVSATGSGWDHDHAIQVNGNSFNPEAAEIFQVSQRLDE